MRDNIFCGVLLFLAISCALVRGDVSAAPSDSVGPAFDIGGDVVQGPAIEYQVASGISFDGNRFLVVWQDYRSGTSYDIFAARVTLGGTIIDEGGFIISDADGYQETPAVAFDGANHLVVWTDMRSGSGDIYGSRVDPSGNVLDPDGLPISVSAGSQAGASVAFHDSLYLVVWIDFRDGNENIYGARVTVDGTVLDPGGIPICTDGAIQVDAALTSNGAGWLAVWTDYRNAQPDIYAARIDVTGAVLDPAGIPVAATAAQEVYPAATFNQTDCLVVWDVDADTTSHDIYGARIDAAGNVLDPGGIAICDHVEYQGYPAASSDGADFLVIWNDSRGSATWDIYGARVDAGGGVIDTTSIPICLDLSQQFGLSVAFGSGRWLIGWHDSRNDHKDIFGIRLDTDGSVLDAASILISSSSVNQSETAMAFDGVNYLVVWHEWREGTGYDIRGTRVSMDGTVLDPAGIEISTHITDAMYPAISFDGSIYLVVWQDYRFSQWDIRATRIETDGTLLDPDGFVISTTAGSQERPAVARNDTRWLVAWQDKRSGSFYDIYGSRVTAGAAVYEPTGLLISAAYGNQVRPAVSSDGDNYIVVWEDGRNALDDIFCARVDRGGVVLDSAGIAVSTAGYVQEHPDVVFDGDSYAIVWQDSRSNVDYDIYMSRVEVDGDVVDPSGILVSGAAGDQVEPALTYNGREYLMIWQDRRGAEGYDIYGAAVDTSGVVLDPDGFEVSGAPHHQMAPDLSPGYLNIVLMSYASFISDEGYGSYRIWANFYDTVAGVPGRDAGDGPARLYPGCPNPFHGSTTLRFSLAESMNVSLKVYDVFGRHVATLTEGPADEGLHVITWDTSSPGGRSFAPGLYFCRLKAGDHHETRKLLLID